MIPRGAARLSRVNPCPLSAPPDRGALNGLPIATTGHDGLTYRRGYDALGRPATATDPRTGTFTTTYWPGTALPRETIDAAGKRLAYTDYDTAGRPVRSLDATSAQNTTRTAYNSRSQVEYQWGSATYPVSYVYDAWGQRVALRTYQSGDSVSWESPSWPGGGAAFSQTVWAYDEPSGLLAKKYDANNNFTEYTCNERGQTAQRFWSRLNGSGQRVAATYGYDGATGEPTAISYNDSTPGVTYAYNRLGQTSAVADYAGGRTFGYDPAAPWRLASETLPAYYGNRVLARTYDTGTTVNTGDGSYSGHTIGTVAGRYRGYRLGTIGTPAADLELTYANSSAGRLAGQITQRGQKKGSWVDS